jgi:hypothetical protein
VEFQLVATETGTANRQISENYLFFTQSKNIHQGGKRSMKKKVISLIFSLLVVAALSLVAGCGGSGGGSSSSGTSGTISGSAN